MTSKYDLDSYKNHLVASRICINPSCRKRFRGDFQRIKIACPECGSKSAITTPDENQNFSVVKEWPKTMRRLGEIVNRPSSYAGMVLEELVATLLGIVPGTPTSAYQSIFMLKNSNAEGQHWLVETCKLIVSRAEGTPEFWDYVLGFPVISVNLLHPKSTEFFLYDLGMLKSDVKTTNLHESWLSGVSVDNRMSALEREYILGRSKEVLKIIHWYSAHGKSVNELKRDIRESRWFEERQAQERLRAWKASQPKPGDGGYSTRMGLVFSGSIVGRARPEWMNGH